MQLSRFPILRSPTRYGVSAILLITMLQTTSAKTLLLSSSTRPEKLKGNPKVVRVERQELGGSTKGAVYLQEVAEYQPGGQEAERSVYRPDGTLSYRQLYEYSSEGYLSKVTIIDGSGATVQSRVIRSPEIGVEEEVLLDPSGGELERVVTKRDRAGQIVESAVRDASGAMSIRLALRNDERGRPAEGEVTLRDQLVLRVEIKYDIDHHTIVTCYAPDGRTLIRTETLEGDLNRELSEILFAENNDRHHTTEQIDARDASGNWTKKTIFQTHTAIQAAEPVAIVERAITYY